MICRKFTLLLLLFALISGSLFSQKIFREGYIVKTTGESFSGLVGYNPNSKIPTTCIFKRFDIAYEVTYSPQQLSAFGYKNGKRYESIDYDGKKSFFETLVKGDITLYSKGSKYYLKKGDKLPFEVKDGKNSLTVEGTQKEFGSLTDLLKYLTSGSKIEIRENLVLKNDLIPVVAAYDRESGKTWNVYNRSFSEKELTLSAWRSGVNRNRFSVLGGINNYILKINPSKDNIYLPESDKVKGLILGLSYERVLSKKSDKLKFRADLLYLHQDFYTYSERKLINYNYSRDDAFYNFTAIKMPLLLQYSFTGKRIIPYFNGGITGMYFFNTGYRHISEVEEVYLNNIRIYEDNDMKFNIGEISATISAGVKIRVVNNAVLNIEGRFEFGTGLFNKLYPEIGSFNQYSIQPSILIGFSF
jgi:hypothetical protein